MNLRSSFPSVTICVLTYGNHSFLARRCLASILCHCDRKLYRLVVGANAVGHATLNYLKLLHMRGRIDRLLVSRRNLNKCPMMRRMFTGVRTEFIWWFDDDSYVQQAGALELQLRHARQSSKTTVIWGQEAECTHPSTFINLKDVKEFIRSAPWYRGLTPPSWEPGGKGEFDFEGRGCGDPRWQFILGGSWFIRTAAIRALDWPDRRLVKLGDDVLLGEAIRQQGWRMANTMMEGVAINQARRRGDRGRLNTEEYADGLTVFPERRRSKPRRRSTEP